MSYARILALTSLAMVAFAGNSLLCRAALRDTAIDAASFTTLRLVSGALMLWLIVVARRGPQSLGGDWPSAFALFSYAAMLSFSYAAMSTATGALLLFGAVQVTMIGYGVWRGDRLRRLQVLGVVLAFGGLIGLLLPGLAAPPLFDSLLMLGSGISWGVYSLRGRGAGDPTRATTGNFLRAVPMTAALSLAMLSQAELDTLGFWYAISSGALSSGIGYAVWYSVLPALRAASAATVQLSVPVIAALGGVMFLGEPIGLRLALASAAILGGIALVIFERRRVLAAQSSDAN